MITSTAEFHEIKSFTRVSVEPSLEPVSLPELLDQANVDVADQASMMQGHIRAARIMVEKACERALMTQTCQLYLDAFPAYELYLERPPVQSITSIQYYDTDGTLRTLDTSKYDLDLISEPCRINPSYGAVWPFTRYRSNAVIVTYVAGYASADLVPESAKLAIKMLASHWYQNREATVVNGVPQQLELAFDSLVSNLKWREYA